MNDSILIWSLLSQSWVSTGDFLNNLSSYSPLSSDVNCYYKQAWTKHKDNLIVMERYHYFASSCRQFGFTCKSLSELERDENESEGALATVFDILKQIHTMFFAVCAFFYTGRHEFVTHLLVCNCYVLKLTCLWPILRLIFLALFVNVMFWIWLFCGISV